MTQESDFDRYDRQFRHINRRLERLEDTQVSPQEFTRELDRFYREIEGVRQEMQEMNHKFEGLQQEMQEMNRKFDVIMQYITGNNPDR